MNFIKKLLPVFLDQNSKDPEELYKIEQSKVFIVSMIFFTIMAFMVSLGNILRNNTFEIHSIAQIILGVALIGILYFHKYKKNFKEKIEPYFFVTIYIFWLWKQLQYQTIQSSTSLLLIFVPIVISYLFSNRYAILGCIAGILINTYVFVTFNLPNIEKLSSIERHTLFMFMLVFIITILLITAFFILKNNSEQKWRNQLSKMMKEDAHKSYLASIGEVSAGIAHEINNPLAVIAFSNRILSMNKKLTDEQREKEHKKIEKTIINITDIVQSLLKLSRKDLKSNRYEYISEIFKDINPLLKQQLAYNKIECLQEIESDFKVYTQLFSQLFLNIYKNSIDALIDIDNPLILTKVSSNKSNLIIHISDNGKGFNDPEKVLTPFYTTKDVGKGTGLGLSLCHKIIASFEGSMKVYNNNGANIKMTIPLNQLS